MQQLGDDASYVVSPSAGDVETVDHRQLRIALAMRGGVSLAVWIGGAVSELDRLRQLNLNGAADPAGDDQAGDDSGDTAGSEIYRRLLELNGFGDVIVDVLSGASAGGLNGVIYAAAQVHGFDMAALGGLWRSVGDIELLARETTAGHRARTADEAGDKITRAEALRPPSLLRGDEYFYREVRRALENQIQAASGPSRVERIALVLSATLFRPAIIRQLVNRTNVVEDGRSNALFRFHHDDTGSTIACDPVGDDAEVDTNLARLAMAARTTSSFPFAFEPAEIAVQGVGEAGLDQLDFEGIFELPNPIADDGLHRVIDGGVLDNIPVNAALQAVVDAPASGPTERWLCYLHPSPGAAAAAPTDEPTTGARGVATLLRTMGTRFNQESLLQDVDQLALVNDGIERRRLARDMLLAPFAGEQGAERLRTELDSDSDKADRGRSILAKLEAQRVLGSLRSPRSVGCDDPPNVPEWKPEQQTALGANLLEAHRRRAEQRRASHSITLLNEATSLLIAYARTLENSGRTQASSAKTTLYELRRDLAELAQREDAMWCQATRNVEAYGDIDTWIDAELDDTLDIVKTDTAVDLANRWRRIGDVAIELSGIDPPAELANPFALLASAGSSNIHATLEALVMTLLPVQLMGRGPWSPVNFVYIHGDAPTGLAFPLPDGIDELRAGHKLAGNQLANFAAFLSARWRANDWMWGRLDAASTLVDALCGPRLLGDPGARDQLTRLAEVDGDADDAAIVTALRNRLQREIFADEVKTVVATPDSAIDPALGTVDTSVEGYRVGHQTLSDLRERRRTRIGMRIAHLAFAVLRPSGGSASSRAVRIASSVLKPLYLAVVFTIVAPSRALLSLAIGSAALQTTFWRATADDDRFDWNAATSIFLVVGLVMALGWSARRIWLRRQQRPPGEDVWLGSSATVGALAAIALFLLVLKPTGGRYISLGVLNLGIALTAIRTLATRWRSEHKTLKRWTSLGWALAALFAIAGIVIGLYQPLWNGDEANWSAVRPLILVLVLAAALVTGISSSWMRPVFIAPAVMLTVAIGLGTFTIAGFDGRVPGLLAPVAWLWIAIASLIAIFVYDFALLFRHVRTRDDSGDGESRRALFPALVIWAGALVALGITLTQVDVDVSLQTWAWVGVLAAAYGNAWLATYLPVFAPPQELTIDT